MAVPENITVEEVKTILVEILDTLESSDYAEDLNEARLSAGNEMLRLMLRVFPMVMGVKMDVIKKYGFSNNREGVISFIQVVREFEADHPEILQLHNRIRKIYLPPVSVSSTVDTSL